MLKAFKWPIITSAAVIALVFGLAGPGATLTVAILAALELSLSMDNAVVNAKVLKLMTPVWQRRFLGWGIIIAVFGMRAVFPLLIVSAVATVTPWDALTMALTDPDRYGATLTSAHPAIVGFGGMFLAMVFFTWLFEDRDVRWLGWIERPLARLGLVDSAAVIATGIALLAATVTIVPGHEQLTVLVSGLAGILTHLLVNGVATAFLHDDAADNVARAGAALFVYIEVLDASFSFDGVIGAFAITSSFLLITAGTGIGAFFVRGSTIEMIRRGTLDTYIHLEHGAHWAIGALAALLILTVRWEIPETVTGLIGAGFVAAAVLTSIISRRHTPRHVDTTTRQSITA
jgi:hypothetical protein